MTPKEKADNLVIIYYHIVSGLAKEYITANFEHLKNNTADSYFIEAKQCALIAVDEILKIVRSDESAIIVELQFWEKVKTEIKNI